MTNRDAIDTIGVVGAGTMGRGIVLAALAAGHAVILCDLFHGAAAKGERFLHDSLQRQQDRGRITSEQLRARQNALTISERLDDLAPCDLVIEAIVEDEGAKAGLFNQLEAIVSEDCIIATNTSSLSVTRLARGLARPGRFLGLHFFNPAHVLPLVEIVAAQQSEARVADLAEALMSAWGKTPVRCASSPGFIVNRVARPFYAEAWRLLEEGAAPPEVIDKAMTDAGGFRMGPFALMDMIGHDVNLSVTRSVYEQMAHDPRYRPSQTQQALVDAGTTGIKAGAGIYDHAPDAPKVSADPASPIAAPRAIVYAPGDIFADGLVALLSRSGMAVQARKSPVPAYLIADGVAIMQTDGRTAASLAAALGMPVALCDLCLDISAAKAVAVTGSDAHAIAVATGLLQAAGVGVYPVADTPGLVVMRTVVMLINEAVDMAGSGQATAETIDTAMVAGVSYPLGPMAWGRRLSFTATEAVIDNLADFYREDRYRPSPHLRFRAAGARA